MVFLKRRWPILSTLIVIAAIATLVILLRPTVAPRPYIQNLNAAPVAAQPLIKSIARRSDAQCYPAIIGQPVTTKIKVTKYNFQKYDFVSVDSVFDNQKIVSLGISCVSSEADFLQLTPTGWKELGPRQM